MVSVHENGFKVSFLIVVLFFNFCFVSTRSLYSPVSTYYGNDYMLYRNTYIIFVKQSRSWNLAQVDCSIRYKGRLLILRDSYKGEAVSNWFRHLGYSK